MSPQSNGYSYTESVEPPVDPFPEWVPNLLHPLIVGLMVGCISLSIVQLLNLLIPEWNGTLFLIAPVLSALAGHYTYRLVHYRYLDGTDLIRVQLVELLVIFLLVKIGSYLNYTWPQVVAEIRTWAEEPLLFFTPEVIVAFGLSVMAWTAAGAVARDVEAIIDPVLYMGEKHPLDRLSERFLLGGVLLLIFAGLSRIGIRDIFDMGRAAISGVIVNVLVYFVLGLILLGQLRFAQLAGIWHRDEFEVPKGLSLSWVGYSAIFLIVALIIAFVLPTGYSVGILDVAQYVLYLIFYVMSIFYLLFGILVAWLISLIVGEPRSAPQTPSLQPVPPQLEPLVSMGEGWSWWPLVRSLLFWGVVLAAIYYLIRSYLSDRPELVASLMRLRPIQLLKRLWQALRSWWLGFRETISVYLPKIRLGGRGGKEGGIRSVLRRIGRSPRERVFYYYLTSLDRAAEEGMPRRQEQTPYEYRSTLTSRLPEGEEALGTLTQSFVEARYSQHPVTSEDVRRVKADWEAFQEALRKLDQEDQES